MPRHISEIVVEELKKKIARNDFLNLNKLESSSHGIYHDDSLCFIQLLMEINYKPFRVESVPKQIYICRSDFYIHLIFKFKQYKQTNIAKGKSRVSSC